MVVYHGTGVFLLMYPDSWFCTFIPTGVTGSEGPWRNSLSTKGIGVEIQHTQIFRVQDLSF